MVLSVLRWVPACDSFHLYQSIWAFVHCICICIICWVLVLHDDNLVLFFRYLLLFIASILTLALGAVARGGCTPGHLLGDDR